MSHLDPIDWALELMYFGPKVMTREADALLAHSDLGRAHHRILFVVARRVGITVGQLRDALGVSTQALQRPMKQLTAQGLMVAKRDPARHRFKALSLTEAGRAMEHAASEAERAVMRAAFAAEGSSAEAGWKGVMEAIARNG